MLTAFVTNWQTAITSAETFTSDNAIIDSLAQKTVTVEQKMKECRDYFQFAKYFIEKTFPDDFTVWNEFGYNDYIEARDRQTKLIEFMQVLYTVAEKYKVKLIAAGFSQARITQISTLKEQLSAANLAQENFKGNRPVLTQDRIKLLNNLWKMTTEHVCRAGKLIYTNNFAKYSRYLLPSEQSELPKEAIKEEVRAV